MLRLVGALDKAKYSPRVYVAATTDSMSARKAIDAEKSYTADVSSGLMPLDQLMSRAGTVHHPGQIDVEGSAIRHRRFVCCL